MTTDREFDVFDALDQVYDMLIVLECNAEINPEDWEAYLILEKFIKEHTNEKTDS